MNTLNLNLIMNQGDSFSKIIYIPAGGVPLDLTGYSFSSEMKQSTYPDLTINPIVATFSFSILNQVTNKGQVQWSLDDEATAAIVTSVSNALEKQRLVTSFVYDVKMTDTLGNITRIIQGLIQVSPEVTL